MAKVNIVVDTETKVMSVELNGSKLANVIGVRISDYSSYGSDKDKEYYVNLTTFSEDATGVKTYTEHMLECEVEKGQAAEGKAVAGVQSNEIPGFTAKPSLTEAQKSIREWLNS
jgi:hypothetical protein